MQFKSRHDDGRVFPSAGAGGFVSLDAFVDAAGQDAARSKVVASGLSVGMAATPPRQKVQYSEPPIPFFVVDRPHRLQFLLDEAKIGERPFKVGLMTTANESGPFRKMIADIKSKNIVKMVDSGVFKKGGAKFTDYEDLYQKYDEMDADYGIILDVIFDKDKTVEAAAKAMAVYEQKPHKFKLVGVAQGKEAQDYLDCYRALKAMGFEHVAIGGMLRAGNRDANKYKVDERLMKDVVTLIRAHYPKDWLFVLGAFHAPRYDFFQQMGVYGSDSKAWHHRYEKLQGGLLPEDNPEIPGRQQAHARKQLLRHIERDIFAQIPARR